MGLAALAIKLDSPGPVLFRQTRHGLGREPFRILKFRSMTATEEDGPVRQATREDARVTRVGRWLRRFNIDELPQLLNVIRGDMSLVGPRPHAIAHDQVFEGQLPYYTRRYRVRPGLTGWAQVNGLRGPTDTREKIERRVRYDLDYIARRSHWLDLKILVLTVVSPAAYRNAF
jgi:lipopolysaccharide/colanic/teichoic acid biosynthesis glycosyltransferase